MFVQLNPPLPLRVVPGKAGSQEFTGPAGDCMAVALTKEHPDHHLVWIVLMDQTGQCWEVENPFIRARANHTWGRNNPERC